MMSLPRDGTPPVISAAFFSMADGPPLLSQPTSEPARASAKASPAPASAFRVLSSSMSRFSFDRSQQHLAPGVGHPALRLPQPARDQAEAQEAEDDSRGNP